jgi:uncharacterized protein (TIGR02757 family)
MTDNIEQLDHASLKELLDFEANRINSPDFIDADPVQFPRKFDKQQDIEIAALLSATLAWGNRTMICRDCTRMFSLMDWQPHRYVMDEGYEELPDMNIHRTFFAKNLRHYLRGLHSIYSRHATLEDFAAACGAPAAELPSWHLVEALNRELAAANDDTADSRCLPLNLNDTALKRVNMALRWLVRDDGIVDMGVWKALKPSQLYIPLDVHVGNVSRELGLLTRKANDKRSVLELTGTLRSFNPDDPVLYDYALFGIGVSRKKMKVSTQLF